MLFVRKLLVIGCIVLSGWSSVSGMVLLKHLSPQQLADRSDLVVRGRVQSTESYWNSSRTKIFTRTRIAVDEAYKGTVPAVVDIVQLGGVIGSIRVTVHGAPHWRVGQEVLVFAEPYEARTYQVTGFSQGKFRVKRHPQTGEAYVVAPRLEGVTLLGAPAGKEPAVSPLGVPLEEFLSDALGHLQRKEVAE
jgi:hypothetical protein